MINAQNFFLSFNVVVQSYNKAVESEILTIEHYREQSLGRKKNFFSHYFRSYNLLSVIICNTKTIKMVCIVKLKELWGYVLNNSTKGRGQQKTIESVIIHCRTPPPSFLRTVIALGFFVLLRFLINRVIRYIKKKFCF